MRVIARTLAALAIFAASALAAQAQPPLEDLPAMLRLQLDQRSAWRAYRDAMALANAEAAREAGQTAIFNSLTTPGRLDAVRARFDTQRAAFERQAAATEAFYAVLSPEQKDVFDALTRAPEPRPPGRRPRSGVGYVPPLPTPPDATALPPPAR